MNQGLGKQQKKVLDLLKANPNSTVLRLGSLLHNKPITAGGKEYNSICRSLHLLENRGLVERENGQIKWHVKA